MQIYRQKELQNLIKDSFLGTAAPSTIGALISNGASFNWIPSSYTPGFINCKTKNYRRKAVHVSYLIALHYARQEKIKNPFHMAVKWVKENDIRVHPNVINNIMKFIIEKKPTCGSSLESITQQALNYNFGKIEK